MLLCLPKKHSNAALLTRTSAQRIPSRPGALCSNEGRIHLRRPSCHFHFLACDKAADHTYRFARQNEAAPGAGRCRVFRHKRRNCPLEKPMEPPVG
jgi:hypothetical protein